MLGAILEAMNCESPEDRVLAVRAALHAAGLAGRDRVGDWIARLLAVETLVPEVYSKWRPLVRDSMAFVSSHLSEERLIPKIVEQLDLPLETTAEERLILLIAQTPGLQKLGQVLARTRGLSPQLRRALQQLENGISDMTAEAIHRIVKDELGGLLPAYEVELNERLLTEASVSAILEFTWRDPETGAREGGLFKVLKPHVPLYYAEDLALLQQLAEYLAQRDYGFASHDVPEMLDEVRTLLRNEVNFRKEQVTLAEVHRLYSRPGVRVPRPILQFCTDRITAMSIEKGVKVTGAYRGNAFRRREVAAKLVEALIAAPMFSGEEDAIFHADPHAGNLLYDEQSQELVVLDWALTGNLTRQERRHVAMLILAMTLRHAGAVRDAIHGLSSGGAAMVDAGVERFFAMLPHACSLGPLDAMRLLDQLGLEGVRFPPSLVLMRKVMFTLDGVLHDVAGDSVRLDTVMARAFLRRWIDGFGRMPAPFEWADFCVAQKAVARYASGSWALG